MKSYKLSFGTIGLINDNLAEVIVDEGVEIDEVMVDEYHDFLLSTLEAPFYLLINKKNSYTYTFGAQQVITQLKEIDSMAVVTTTDAGIMSTKTLISMNYNDTSLNVKMFREREEALAWLKKAKTCA